MFVVAKYLNRELIAVFVVTLLMLLLVAVGGRLIGYLQEAAMGWFSGATVLTIIGLRMPEFVQLVAPFAGYVAILLTFGRLYAEQEMVVLQGAGVSTVRLLGWVSWSLAFIVALVAILAWTITPMAQRALVDFLSEKRADSEFEVLNAGTFHTYDRGQRVTYSGGMSEDRSKLYDVFLSQRMSDGRTATVWAAQGSHETSAEDGTQYLVLADGERYESGFEGMDMRIMAFGHLRQRLQVSRATYKRLEVEALPTGALGNGPRDVAEWHWRMGLPLFALISGLLAVGISRVRPRQGRFAKVLPGMLLMLLYYLLLLLGRSALGEGQLPSMVGLWPVHALFGGIAAFLLNRLGRPVSAR